jgi:hypothetical protein
MHFKAKKYFEKQLLSLSQTLPKIKKKNSIKKMIKNKQIIIEKKQELDLI